MSLSSRRLATTAMAVMAALVAGTLRAEIPQPPVCERLQLLIAPQQARLAGTAGPQWVEGLARHSGLQLHVRQPDDDAVVSFASGVQDLWLGSSLEMLQQTGGHPLQPPLWQEQYWLWFRAGELTDVQQLPVLSGMRGGYWPEQLEQGQLATLAVHVGLDNLRVQAGPAAALQAVLDGDIDFFMSDSETLAVIDAVNDTEALEALAQPLLVRPYYLALSNNSACKDKAVIGLLEAAIIKVQEQE